MLRGAANVMSVGRFIGDAMTGCAMFTGAVMGSEVDRGSEC